jgi:predicted nuclease of predicted toxin-antitoxin system
VKFLIDECLHESLVAIARHRGHDAGHVNWIGLRGWKDWRLMKRVIAGDYTFVTNNARDFRKLFGREPIHAGLVIIVPNVPPAGQQDLFLAALDVLAADDDNGVALIDQVVEVSLTPDGDVVVERYELFRRDG